MSFRESNETITCVAMVVEMMTIYRLSPVHDTCRSHVCYLANETSSPIPIVDTQGLTFSMIVLFLSFQTMILFIFHLKPLFSQDVLRQKLFCTENDIVVYFSIYTECCIEK